jgi:hypothetical protein
VRGVFEGTGAAFEAVDAAAVTGRSGRCQATPVLEDVDSDEPGADETALTLRAATGIGGCALDRELPGRPIEPLTAGEICDCGTAPRAELDEAATAEGGGLTAAVDVTAEAVAAGEGNLVATVPADPTTIEDAVPAFAGATDGLALVLRAGPARCEGVAGAATAGIAVAAKGRVLLGPSAAGAILDAAIALNEALEGAAPADAAGASGVFGTCADLITAGKSLSCRDPNAPEGIGCDAAAAAAAEAALSSPTLPLFFPFFGFTATQLVEPVTTDAVDATT